MCDYGKLEGDVFTSDSIGRDIVLLHFGIGGNCKIKNSAIDDNMHISDYYMLSSENKLLTYDYSNENYICNGMLCIGRVSCSFFGAKFCDF
ncbi:MAG: hypothetical protein LBH08_01275 [Puniceicoccales bacterium]|nr:hypothetical protein [Puniceicoccales bacterium]